MSLRILIHHPTNVIGEQILPAEIMSGQDHPQNDVMALPRVQINLQHRVEATLALLQGTGHAEMTMVTTIVALALLQRTKPIKTAMKDVSGQMVTGLGRVLPTPLVMLLLQMVSDLRIMLVDLVCVLRSKN